MTLAGAGEDRDGVVVVLLRAVGDGELAEGDLVPGRTPIGSPRMNLLPGHIGRVDGHRAEIFLDGEAGTPENTPRRRSPSDVSPRPGRFSQRR